MSNLTPLTLSIETEGGVALPIIKRGTPIPVKRSLVVSPVKDGQTQAQIRILQGERRMAADNRSLGHLALDDIPSKPRGIPQIEVTFEINADGMLQVSTQDKSTGREETITIKDSGDLAEEEITRLVEEAEGYAEEDARRHREAEADLSQANITLAEDALRDLGAQIPQDFKNQTEEQIEITKKALETDDAETIQRESRLLRQQIAQSRQVSHQSPDAVTLDQAPQDSVDVYVAAPSEELPFTVFLSYAESDGASLARQLYVDLRLHKFNVWRTGKSILSPAHEQTIYAAIDQSHAMVILMTEEALYSPMMRRLLSYVFETKKVPILPALAPGLKSQDLAFGTRTLEPVHIHDDYYAAMKQMVEILREIEKA